MATPFRSERESLERRRAELREENARLHSALGTRPIRTPASGILLLAVLAVLAALCAFAPGLALLGSYLVARAPRAPIPSCDARMDCVLDCEP